MLTLNTSAFRRILTALLAAAALSGPWLAPVHADPSATDGTASVNGAASLDDPTTPPDKGKPGKGKGDGGGDKTPIKVEPPIITKDPKSPPTPQK